MEFSNSPLVNYTRISPNRTKNRNHEIDTITIHCVVGQCSVETLGAVFAPTSRRACSNYGIGYDGRIGMYCEEEDRSWCSSSAANDHRAITIEVASDTFDPYKVKPAAYEALIRLLVDICKRNNIPELRWKADKSLVGQPEKQNMTVHRWFAATSCPGDYLYNLHGQIAEEVNAQLRTAEEKKDFCVGDKVTFTGSKHYVAANGAFGLPAKQGRATITKIYDKGKHKYHLVRVSGGGSNVYGWVDAEFLSRE